MNLLKKIRGSSLKTKSSIAIIATSALLIEATSIVQYWYAQNRIREEMRQRAESELRAKNLEIHNVISSVEVAVNNMSWAVERGLGLPDSMYAITTKLLEDNDIIVGSAVAFEPNYFKEKGRQFSPYSYRHGDSIRTKQLGTDQYDYHTMEWYTAPMASGSGHWSEPYFDKGGGDIMMSTFSVPIRDKQGRKVAVFTADVSLDWLSVVTNARPIYPSSYNFLISQTGRVIACPVESLLINTTIQQITAGMEDTTIRKINEEMMAGRDGHAVVYNQDGDKNYVFYAHMDGKTGWSMAVVCSDNEIFYSLRRMGFNLLILMLVGMALLAYIIYRAAKSATRLSQVRAEKERIASELHIASEIQKSMLPKIFPPYPERDDVDIHASLVPAKEVGGDLYDFYIRDEKLFFCIGDVSGKGVPASLVMAVTRSLFRTISAHEAQPDRIMTTINESMADNNEANMFVTLFIGALDLPTGRLRYCNAGHDAPILVRADGQDNGLLPVDANLPVGVMGGWKFTSQEALIDPHTTIFLYTDGLTEAEDAHHAQFGQERMMNALKTTLMPKPMIEQMTLAVHQFVSNAEQSDDLTMLAIRYTKEHLDVRMQRSITLPNEIDALPRLHDFVDEVCERMGFDASTTMQMNLAIEEAVVNVINYAYPPETSGTINIEAQANDLRLKFTITDNGKAFDPTAKEEVDTTLSVEERPIGGLGIHLVRQLMDTINYERLEGKNILTLRKRL